MHHDDPPTALDRRGGASLDRLLVQFTPTVSGTYTFKINRYANRDTANKLRMGLVVNYFN